MGVLVFVTIRFGPELTRLVSNQDKLREWLRSYGYKGAAVFILLQVLQVVVAAIPGEVVQLAGGYVYGVFPGTALSLAGILIGSIIVFYVSRFLGFSLVKTFVSEKNLQKFEFMMNHPKSEVIMLVLFLIPGIPKDVLTYIAGLTPVKPLRFFIIITVARFPGLFGSAFIGANWQKGNYTAVIITSVLAVVLFTAGLLLKDRIIKAVGNATQTRK